MNLNSVIWLVLPLIALVIVAVIKSKIKDSKKATKIGIVLAVIIVSAYYGWRLLDGSLFLP